MFNAEFFKELGQESSDAQRYHGYFDTNIWLCCISYSKQDFKNVNLLHDINMFIFCDLFSTKVQNGNHNKFDIGMKVEVSDKHNLVSMCVATIVDIVGDRLRLRYDGLDAEMNEDFLCHYLACDIHPVGWSSLVGHTLQPPVGRCCSCLIIF